jgi:hypothetical protein
MKKYFVAACLLVAFAGPAFAEQFYIAFDPSTHKCSMMSTQPGSSMKVMGSYATQSEAHKAMTGMKECQA